MNTARNKLWRACRSAHAGAFDFRTINAGWRDAFTRLGFNQKTNNWNP